MTTGWQFWTDRGVAPTGPAARDPAGFALAHESPSGGLGHRRGVADGTEHGTGGRAVGPSPRMTPRVAAARSARFPPVPRRRTSRVASGPTGVQPHSTSSGCDMPNGCNGDGPPSGGATRRRGGTIRGGMGAAPGQPGTRALRRRTTNTRTTAPRTIAPAAPGPRPPVPPGGASTRRDTGGTRRRPRPSGVTTATPVPVRRAAVPFGPTGGGCGVSGRRRGSGAGRTRAPRGDARTVLRISGVVRIAVPTAGGAPDGAAGSDPV